MTTSPGLKLESKFVLVSDWLPETVFTTIYDNLSEAIATAMEGVADPIEHEVRVVDVATGKVVWRSTEEEYE